MSRPADFEGFAVCTVLAGLCVCLLACLAPNIEMGSTEARMAEAWIRVRQLKQLHGRTPDPVERARSEDVPTVDPWGTPYRVIDQSDAEVLAVSAGPDRVFQALSSISDDIHTDLEEAPMAPIRRRKRWQLGGAFVVSIGAWLVLCRLYRRARRSQ